MNPFPMDVLCDVCGGPGVASIRTAGAQWYGEIAHSDPRVCRSYLRLAEERRQREAEQFPPIKWRAA